MSKMYVHPKELTERNQIVNRKPPDQCPAVFFWAIRSEKMRRECTTFRPKYYSDLTYLSGFAMNLSRQSSEQK
jgi:hypothetical protein